MPEAGFSGHNKNVTKGCVMLVYLDPDKARKTWKKTAFIGKSIFHAYYNLYIHIASQLAIIFSTVHFVGSMGVLLERWPVGI